MKHNNGETLGPLEIDVSESTCTNTTLTTDATTSITYGYDLKKFQRENFVDSSRHR